MVTAIEPTSKRIGHRVIWKCQCDCGSVYFATSNDLLHGHAKSCGCKRISALSAKAKEAKEDMKKDIGMRDGTNITLIESDTVFVTSSTGVRGVNRDGPGKYRARLQFQGKTYTKHGFDTIEDAKKERDRMYEEIVVPYLKSVGRL